MRAEIAEEWERRLRSGDYPQVSGYLRTKKGHCCLGVLAEMACEAGVVERVDGGQWYRYRETGGLDLHRSVLPGAVVNWAGLNTGRDPYLRDGPSLSSLNDIGVPFTEIADKIHESRDTL